MRRIAALVACVRATCATLIDMYRNSEHYYNAAAFLDDE